MRRAHQVSTKFMEIASENGERGERGRERERERGRGEKGREDGETLLRSFALAR